MTCDFGDFPCQSITTRLHLKVRGNPLTTKKGKMTHLTYQLAANRKQKNVRFLA